MPSTLDLLEATAPASELVDPTAAASRHAVADLAERAGLGRADTDALVLATSEVVTNATRHGRPPVLVRLWAAAERVVVTVSDRGEGPKDADVGLAPGAGAGSGEGGFGLWLAHELTAVFCSSDATGFTVHLLTGCRAGAPPASASRKGRG